MDRADSIGLTVHPKMPDETAIQDYVSKTSLQRGEDYYEMGAVLSIIKSGSRLFALVEGSSYSPYRLCIRMEEDHPKSASCTCPYDWGGYCKHIVAAFLTYTRDPNAAATVTPLEEILASFDAKELHDLVIHWVERDPDLLWELEGVEPPDNYRVFDDEYY